MLGYGAWPRSTETFGWYSVFHAWLWGLAKKYGDLWLEVGFSCLANVSYCKILRMLNCICLLPFAFAFAFAFE
jgi:hypothetical protein